MLDYNLLDFIHTLLKECEVKFTTSASEFSALLQLSQDHNINTTNKGKKNKKVKIHARRGCAKMSADLIQSNYINEQNKQEYQEDEKPVLSNKILTDIDTETEIKMGVFYTLKCVSKGGKLYFRWVDINFYFSPLVLDKEKEYQSFFIYKSGNSTDADIFWCYYINEEQLNYYLTHIRYGRGQIEEFKNLVQLKKIQIELSNLLKNTFDKIHLNISKIFEKH